MCIRDSHNTHPHYDGAILQEITCHHLEALKDDNRFNTACRLIQPRPASPELRQLVADTLDIPEAEVHCSAAARFRFGTLHRRDLISFPSNGSFGVGVAEVLVALPSMQEEFILINKLVLSRGRSCYSQWSMPAATDYDIVYLNEVVSTHVWNNSDGVVTVLHPYAMQL